MKFSTTCFGAYDIRGIVPEEVNEELAYRIGKFFPMSFKAKKVVVGHNIRLSGPGLQEAKPISGDTGLREYYLESL